MAAGFPAFVFRTFCVAATVLSIFAAAAAPSAAQVAPSAREAAAYRGLLAAAWRNDAGAVQKLIAGGAKTTVTDQRGRTAVHIAAHRSAYAALQALVTGGANIRAFDRDRYDAITIAAVKNDVRMLRLALKLGGNPKAITSPYDGTALIAAAHLGHVAVVDTLIKAGAPLDHVNNLGWTALIEAVILGDGGKNHIACVKALVTAGANRTIADRNGVTPLQHARRRGYSAMVNLLK